MITLAAGATVAGVAQTAATVNFSLSGDEVTTTDSFKTLAQGQLAAAAATIYTAPALTATLLNQIHLANTASSNKTFGLYLNGTAAANLIFSGTLPANGGATYDGTSWKIYDANGVQQYVGSTGPSGTVAVGTVTNVGSAGPPTVTNVGTGAAAVLNFGLQQGATGSTGAPGDVQDVTAGSAKIAIGGTAAHPTVDIGTGVVLNARQVATTAPLTGGGDLSADRTLAISAATTAVAGSMSANDKLKADNLWIDANTVGISTGNSGATNVTAFNAWYATAPSFCTLYFPPGLTYDFASELTLNRDIRIRFLGAGKGRSVLRSTSATANLFNQTVAAFYISFEELGFSASVTKTAGAAITFGNNNALCDIRRCEFDAQFRSIDLASGGMNIGVINECVFASPSSTAGGSQIRVNGSGINMMIQNCTINVTGFDVIGIEINQCGAFQIGNCDFIGGRNTMLVNATGIVAALFVTNTFFDQATLGSTVKIAGTASISRCKFIQCGITNGGGSGLVALEIAGTGTGTGIPEAIDFEQCDFYNNGFAGTTTGLLLTGVRGIDIKDCRISGFTTGISLTSYNGAGVTNFNIQGNTIGPTENFAGNGTGIVINAGSFAYGPSNISYNDLSGNTTAALTDNGTYASNLLQLVGNFGLAVAAKAETPATLIPLTTPVTRAGSGWAFGANTLRVGAHLRITVGLTCAATLQTLTPTLKMGTANTNADADLIGATAMAAGTAALGSMTCVYNVFIASATTVVADAQFYNGVAGLTGVTSVAFTGRGSAGPITVASIASTAFFLAPYFVSATAAAVTVRAVTYEVISQ